MIKSLFLESRVSTILFTFLEKWRVTADAATVAEVERNRNSSGTQDNNNTWIDIGGSGTD